MNWDEGVTQTFSLKQWTNVKLANVTMDNSKSDR